MDASDRRFRSRTNASTPRDAAKTSSSCRCCWLGGGAGEEQKVGERRVSKRRSHKDKAKLRREAEEDGGEGGQGAWRCRTKAGSEEPKQEDTEEQQHDGGAE